VKRRRLPLWKIIHLLGVACLSLGNLAFGPPVLREKDIGGMKLYPSQVRQMGQAQVPQVGARAYLLADEGTGQVLLAHNEHEPLPPASLTKLMTAVVALERASPEAQVQVGEEVEGVEGMKMGLVRGEVLSLGDLLYGLLVASANDAAMAIAVHVAGSVEEFVALMNAKAAELGLTETHFVNPHGLDAEGHYSSAHDLLVLTRYALSNPLLARIVATREYNASGHQLLTTNEFLSLYEGADGVKTGTTEKAGQCLIASVTRDGRRIVAVILGSSDRYADAQALFDYYFGQYVPVTLEAKPSPLNRWRDPQGRLFRLKSTEKREILLERWQAPLLHSFRLISGFQGNSSGPVGELIFYIGDVIVGRIPLTAHPIETR